jgi:hypothetical protein
MMATTTVSPAVEGFKARQAFEEKIKDAEGEVRQAKKEVSDAETSKEGADSALNQLPDLQKRKADGPLAARVAADLEELSEQRAKVAKSESAVNEQRKPLQDRAKSNGEKQKLLDGKKKRAAATQGKGKKEPESSTGASSSKPPEDPFAEEAKALDEEAEAIKRDTQALLKQDSENARAVKEIKERQIGLLYLQKLLDRQPWLEDPTKELKEASAAAIGQIEKAQKNLEAKQAIVEELKEARAKIFDQIDPEAQRKLDEQRKLKEEEASKGKELSEPKGEKRAPEKKGQAPKKAEGLNPEQTKKLEAGKRSDFYKYFEADLSEKTARELEQRLAELHSKIRNAFPNQEVKDIVKCPIGRELVEYADRLEAEIHDKAHRAPCHLCAEEERETVNGVRRDGKAINLILKKVKELEELADKPGKSADHQLARALDILRKNKDEKDQTGGKMLGVLVCRNKKTGEEVLIYGYSGTLPPQSHVVGAKVIPLKRLWKAEEKVIRVGEELAEEEKKLLEMTKVFKEPYDLAAKESEELLKKAKDRVKEDRESAKERANLESKAWREKADARRKLRVDDAKLVYARATEGVTDEQTVREAQRRYELEFGDAEEEYKRTLQKSFDTQQENMAEFEKKLQDYEKQEEQEHQKRLANLRKQYKIQDLEAVQKRKEVLEKELKDWKAVAAERQEKYQDTEALRKLVEEGKAALSEANKQDTATEESTWEEGDGSVIKWVRSLSKEKKKGDSSEPVVLLKKPTGPQPYDGLLWSKSGDAVSLEALNKGHDGTPHGVCSAPKMIQMAYQLDLEIVSMAEAWFGGGTNTHGELVASCNTCMKNIGFQLCERKHDH